VDYKVPESPLVATPPNADPDAWFDVKVVYQQDHNSIDISSVPEVFKPQVGPFKLTDYEKVYGAGPTADIFELRGLNAAASSWWWYARTNTSPTSCR
jgi:phenol 2-monooxygenase